MNPLRKMVINAPTWIVLSADRERDVSKSLVSSLSECGKRDVSRSGKAANGDIKQKEDEALSDSAAGAGACARTSDADLHPSKADPATHTELTELSVHLHQVCVCVCVCVCVSVCLCV